jgi:sugar/nucleoside kinase (ribokinase family)
LAADFGHGAISKKMMALLCDIAPYLAVNTQANAGNRGFHTITGYKRADFISLAEHEIRLETRDLNGPLREQLNRLAEQLKSRTFIVTRGRRGCLIRGKDDSFVSVPSLASKVVDRVGAGDAFFSLTAMASVLGVSDELIGFLGNVAGSLIVESIGNKTSINRLAVKKYITTLLK